MGERNKVVSATINSLYESPLMLLPHPNINHQGIAMNAPDQIKIDTNDTATHFLLGELIKASMKRFKSLAVPYMELRQSEQQSMLRDVEEDIRKAVREAVEIIASDYRITFRASCESVQFKTDGVKAQLTMFNSPEAHALADAAGNTIMVVIEDASRYLDAGDSCDGEPDQRKLPV
jgi:predicted phage-related endonuclease